MTEFDPHSSASDLPSRPDDSAPEVTAPVESSLPLPAAPQAERAPALNRPRPALRWSVLLVDVFLVALVAIGVYFRFDWVNWNQDTDIHPDEYGLTGTLTSLSMLAMDFRDAVNQIPGLVLCDPWPPKLRVNDISLEGGGLFDVRGWDVQRGQMWSAEWEPPHYTHRDGTVVDISANYPCANNLLRALLIRLGRQYGTWIGGPVLTLKMDAGLLRSNSAAPTANPDLGVVAFRSDRDVPTVARRRHGPPRRPRAPPPRPHPRSRDGDRPWLIRRGSSRRSCGPGSRGGRASSAARARTTSRCGSGARATSPPRWPS